MPMPSRPFVLSQIKLFEPASEDAPVQKVTCDNAPEPDIPDGGFDGSRFPSINILSILKLRVFARRGFAVYRKYLIDDPPIAPKSESGIVIF